MSKGTEKFKTVIQDYLAKRAESDELFAAQYLKPNKNIEAYITYILNTVQKSGCAGFDDDEVFLWRSTIIQSSALSKVCDLLLLIYS